MRHGPERNRGPVCSEVGRWIVGSVEDVMGSLSGREGRRIWSGGSSWSFVRFGCGPTPHRGAGRIWEFSNDLWTDTLI